VQSPDAKETEVVMPILNVPNTAYNIKILVIVGTNVFRFISNTDTENRLTAMLTMKPTLELVKCCHQREIEVKTFQTKIITGMFRKERYLDSAIKENSSFNSSRLKICPRIVQLNKPAETHKYQ
jgi:hypothetical protein